MRKKTKVRLMFISFIFPVTKIYTVLLYDVLNIVDAKLVLSTVKPVLSVHSKIDKTHILMINGSIMQVESIADCSPWSILQYF